MPINNVLKATRASYAVLRMTVGHVVRHPQWWHDSHTQSGSLRGIAGRVTAAAVTVILGVSSVLPLRAAEFVELRIPLRDAAFYRARDFYAECNRQLGTNYPLDQVDDRLHELTVAEKLSLLWLSQRSPDVCDARLSADQLVLRLPASSDPDVRQQQRKRLAQLLGVRAPVWPPGKGLLLPSPISSRQRTVLLVHGLNADTKSFRGLARAFAAYDVQVLSFDYPDDGPIAAVGDRLRRDLWQLSRDQPNLRLVIVAHSMGGLVSRYALERPPGPPACVTDLFTLGTPHQGSRLAVGQPWLEICQTWNSVFSGQIKRADGAQLLDGMSAAAQDLKPASPFLQELARNARPSSVRYHVAAGCKGFFTAEEQNQAVADLDRILREREVPLPFRSSILDFARTPELQSERGDGVVALESALLPDADTRRTFDLNHVELLAANVQRPEESDVFRWIVDTLHWSREHAK